MLVVGKCNLGLRPEGLIPRIENEPLFLKGLYVYVILQFRQQTI